MLKMNSVAKLRRTVQAMRSFQVRRPVMWPIRALNCSFGPGGIGFRIYRVFGGSSSCLGLSVFL